MAPIDTVEQSYSRDLGLDGSVALRPPLPANIFRYRAALKTDYFVTRTRRGTRTRTQNSEPENRSRLVWQCLLIKMCVLLGCGAAEMFIFK